MLVKIYNPETKDLERSYLAEYTDEGATTIELKNNESFAAGQAILIGQAGNERSEVAETDGVTGSTTVTLDGTTELPHNADDPVYVLEFDQVKIYRAVSIAGTYNLIDTIDLRYSDPQGITRYDDPTGLSSSYYKIKNYNSVEDEESEFSDPIPATGYPEDSLGYVVDQVVREVHDTGFSVLSIDDYIAIAQEVGDDLLTQSHRPYRFQKTHELLDTVADQNYVALPANLWKFDFLKYTYTVGGYSRKYEPDMYDLEDWIDRFENSSWASNDELQAVAIDEEEMRLYIHPKPRTSQTGKIRLHFYQKIPTLTSLSDTLITPNKLIYKYRLKMAFFLAKSEVDNQFKRIADDYATKYGNEVVKMQRSNRLDTGTPRSMPKRRMPGYRRRYTL